ncbi:MAG: hypothetical protein ABMA02_08210 [Saprospiraceae bacterium]
MRNILICVTWLGLFGPDALSQPTFLTSFDPNLQDPFQADKGKDIWSIGKHVYVASGFVHDNGKRENQIFMVDADTRQIVKEIKYMGPQGDMTITDYMVTSDQHILLAGEWRNYAAGGRMCLFLTKLTPDLETVWINYYPDLSTHYLYCEGIAETGAGDYMLCIADSPPPAPHATGELRMIKTDTSGTILLDKMLTDTFTQTAGYGNMIPTDDGHFLVSTFVIGYYYHPIQGTFRYNTVLHKIDAEANQVWTKTLNYAKFDRQGPVCAPLAGGGGAVMWRKDTFGVVGPEVAWEFSLMYGMDSDGNIDWTREWNTWPYKIVYQVKQANNGDILGVGYYRDSGGWPNKGKGWLFRMTNAGEPLWERHYSDSLLRPWSPHLELLDLCEMDDGRIAATGIVVDTNEVSWNLNVALLIIDANGCIEPGCSGPTQYVTSTSVPLYSLPPLPVLHISPNPTSGPVSITLPEGLVPGKETYELLGYATDGRLLKRLAWPPGSPTLQVADWGQTNGIVRLLLLDQGRPVAAGKFSVHR